MPRSKSHQRSLLPHDCQLSIRVAFNLKGYSAARYEQRGKNIWYIHPYAGGPSVGSHFRPYELCRAWNTNHGCRARVIFPSFHHLLTTDRGDRSSFRVGPVDYHAVPSPSYHGNGLQRVVQMTAFSTRLFAFGRELVRANPSHRPDVVIASSPHPFCAVASARLARAYGARFVFEIRDIWPLSLTELGEAPPLHPFVLVAGACEKSALRRATLVASVLPRADRYLSDRGFGSKPFVWAPNGLKEDDAAGSQTSQIPATAEVLDVLHTWRAQERLSMIYVGSMGPSNGIRRLVDALGSHRLLPLKDKLGVMLVGSGSERTAVESAQLQTHVPIHWSRGQIPSADVSAVLRHADFAYAGLRDLPNLYRYGVSFNKLPEYMGVGLPVILPCDPCGDAVSEAGAGIVRAALARDDLARMIVALATMPERDRKLMGQRGLKYVAENYSYRKIAAHYLEAFTQTGGRN